MVTMVGGAAGAPQPRDLVSPMGAGAPRDIGEAFEAAKQGLPALRDALVARPQEAAQAQALSRDIKLTLTRLVADLKRMPDTADEAFRLALCVASAAAGLGAMDGAVNYVGQMLPLRIAEDESQSPEASRITRAFESTGDEVLQGAEQVRRAEGLEPVRSMSRIAKSLAARQMDDIRAVPDLSTYQRAVVELMLTSYTAGILDACELCPPP